MFDQITFPIPKTKRVIIITGAAGFIGSCLVAKFNEEKIYHLGLVDDFSSERKKRNYESKRFLNVIERSEFLNWLDLQHESIECIFHLGARTNTAEFDSALLNELNLNYSKEVWNRCVQYDLPLIYASSAATYGAGELGYKDSHQLIYSLKPLNPYGISKNEFDKWVLLQNQFPPFWCGLKFFNVYGPNEYHKGRMASVVYHGFNEVRQHGSIKLFRSHRSDFSDGEQLRDFVYVKDAVDVMIHFYKQKIHSGIYNLGTGKARTFHHLADSLFSAMNLPVQIEWIDIPDDIREKYQYFTEADMSKLRGIGYDQPFFSLEEGVRDYVSNYLLTEKVW